MKKTLLLGITVLTVSLTTVAVQAEQWQIVGPRALGMGGAHVAVVNDATAQYWNPGAFGFFDEPLPGQREKKQKLREEIKKSDKQKEKKKEKEEEVTEIKKGAEIAFGDEEGTSEDWNGYSQRFFGIHISAGTGIQVFGDAVDEVDDIVDKDFQALFDKAKSNNAADNLDTDDIAETIDILNEINDLEDPDLGIIVLANAGVGMRIGHFGVGVYVLGEIASNFDVDFANIGFTSSTFGGNAVDALSTDVDGLPALNFDTPGGLSAAQRTQIFNTVRGFPKWQLGAPDRTQQFVDAADQGIAESGRVATAEDVETIIQMAKIASEIPSVNGGQTFDDNQTSVTFIGPVILEVPLTYGYAINDYWSIGGNVKYMHAEIFFTRFTVFETDSDDFLADAYRNSEESDNFGIDLGTLARFSDFRIGFVGRNLNEPKFDYTTDDEEEMTWTVNPQVRGGIAYMPCDWFTMAVDADITRNKTAKEDFQSQLVSGGLELNLYDFFAIRGGAYTNIGDSTSHDELVYTAGLGFNLWGIHLDVGAAMSANYSEFDDQFIPNGARGELALSAQF